MPRLRHFVLATCLFVSPLSLGCAQKDAAARPSGPVASASAPIVRSARGVIKSISADGKTLTIKHEAIPGYMAAMTMPFDVARPALSAGLKAGDAIAFTFHQDDDHLVIDSVDKLPADAG